MGGAGGGRQEHFPAPGETTTTDPQNPQADRQPQQQTPPQNPFAAFGPGMGANPFGPMFGIPPNPQGAQQPPSSNITTDTPSTNPTSPQQANPFAALFNPAMFGGQQQQGNSGNAGADGGNTAGQAQNPFANNPFLNNPQALQAMLQGLTGGAGGNTQQPDWMNMLGGGFGQPPDNRPPEERYATQLRQLNEMGFHNFDRNIQALSRSGGDVNGALEWLFNQS
jgi:ubiquilin